MARGMELHFFGLWFFKFRSLKFNRNRSFSAKFQGFSWKFWPLKNIFRTLENRHSIRQQSIPPLSAGRAQSWRQRGRNNHPGNEIASLPRQQAPAGSDKWQTSWSNRCANLTPSSWSKYHSQPDCVVISGIFLGGDLDTGERHSRDTWDDRTVTLCALRAGAATVLSRNCCEGDVALAWRSGCHGTIVDKHCTSHGGAEFAPFCEPPLKVPDNDQKLLLWLFMAGAPVLRNPCCKRLDSYPPIMQS